ncbi:MAG TPA: DUF1634 domain-containing protein [Gemmatimonadaceae bacterium]
MRDSRDEQVELVIGRLLQWGVLTAAIVVVVGGLLLLAQYGHLPANFRQFNSEDAALRSVGGIVRAVLSGDSRAIVQLGLVLLIATPAARVALTLGAFVIQRDRLYILTTSLVLALLLYGLFWGRA